MGMGIVYGEKLSEWLIKGVCGMSVSIWWVRSAIIRSGCMAHLVSLRSLVLRGPVQDPVTNVKVRARKAIGVR